MGEFFRLLLDSIHSWWPIRLIDAGCQGVLYRHDGTVRLLSPGRHYFWPKLWRIEEVQVQTQNTDCGLQSLTTKDGVEITLSLNVTYSIDDAAVLWTAYSHFDSTLINIARGHAAEIIAETSWEEILSDPAGVSSEIQETVMEDVGPSGVMVEDVTMDQLSRVKTLRLLQTQSI